MASITAAGKSSQRFPALRVLPRGSHTFLGTKATTFIFVADICLPREFLESKVSEKMMEEHRREKGEGGEEGERERKVGRTESLIKHSLGIEKPHLPPGEFRCFQSPEVAVLDKPVSWESGAENPKRAQK